MGPVLLLVFHVFANMVWIGSITSVGWLTAAAARIENEERADAIAQAAVQLYRRAAVPAFVLSLAFGLVMLLRDPGAYMKLHWFHGKLTFAILVVALHHVLGARAKKAAATRGGSRQAGGSSAILALVTLVFAFLTVTFAVFKGLLVR